MGRWLVTIGAIVFVVAFPAVLAVPVSGDWTGSSVARAGSALLFVLAGAATVAAGLRVLRKAPPLRRTLTAEGLGSVHAVFVRYHLEEVTVPTRYAHRDRTMQREVWVISQIEAATPPAELEPNTLALPEVLSEEGEEVELARTHNFGAAWRAAVEVARSHAVPLCEMSSIRQEPIYNVWMPADLERTLPERLDAHRLLVPEGPRSLAGVREQRKRTRTTWSWRPPTLLPAWIAASLGIVGLIGCYRLIPEGEAAELAGSWYFALFSAQGLLIGLWGLYQLWLHATETGNRVTVSDRGITVRGTFPYMRSWRFPWSRVRSLHITGGSLSRLFVVTDETWAEVRIDRKRGAALLPRLLEEVHAITKPREEPDAEPFDYKPNIQT